MKNALHSLIRKAAGIVLILIGIAGLFIPILQGWIFIVGGVALLNPPLGEKMKIWFVLQFERGKFFLVTYFNRVRSLLSL